MLETRSTVKRSMQVRVLFTRHFIALSSNGRIEDFESFDAGSSPAGATNETVRIS